MPTDLSRFQEAQESDHAIALQEVKQGRKQNHWMWYIFPQLAGLGQSSTSKYYAIKDRNEAQAFLDEPVLGQRLIEISQALLAHPHGDAHRIFGSPDDLKLRSCMTLFAALENTHPVFQAVLDKYFGGRPDPETVRRLA